MNVFGFLKTGVVQEEQEGLQRSALNDNFRRGRILAAAAIAFETVYCIITIIAFALQADKRFNFFYYLGLYAIMVIMSVLFIIFINKTKNVYELPQKKLAYGERVVVLYITFFTVWGSAVTLLDQKLYGGLIAFMVNVIFCSVVFLLDAKSMAVPFAASVTMLAAGLPFFQSSADVLIGHYVNMSFFVAVTWIVSRMLYRTYCSDYQSKTGLKEANRILGEQISENKAIQARLSALNVLLEEMSLVDDLTKIPNRRGFRHFIETSFKYFSKGGIEVSIMVADIDCFKNYNDKYGHMQGDNVLVAVAKEIQSSVRDNQDFAARWGGEEFIIITYGDRDAWEIAEDIRVKVQDLNIPHGYSEVCGFVTISIGICRMAIGEKNDIHVAVDRADDAMYQAKIEGRNRVRVSDGRAFPGRELQDRGAPLCGSPAAQMGIAVTGADAANGK
jgi:diguanylate cyclase (GGDEF)-like protein